MPAIRVQDLHKTFLTKRKAAGLRGSLRALFHPDQQAVEAVRGISFEMEPSELVGFIGPNGAGKSTTIKILTGILYPTRGQAEVLGFVPWQQRQKLAYHIGTVFGQRPQLWYHLPALDTFYLFGKIYELEDADVRKRIAFLAEAFEIQDLLETPVRKLSLGQRMRCEVAASLLHRPRLLLLDEPSIGLDGGGQAAHPRHCPPHERAGRGGRPADFARHRRHRSAVQARHYHQPRPDRFPEQSLHSETHLPDLQNDGVYFVFWIIFFDRFKQVRGWVLGDMFLVFGIVAAGVGLANFFFGNAVNIVDVIVTGRLDYYLSLPRPVLLHVLASRSHSHGIGDVLYGLLSFFMARQFSLDAFLRFCLGSLVSMTIFLSFIVLVQSLSFWLGNTQMLSQQATNAIITFAIYPITLFDGSAKFILFTIIPAAFVGALPAEIVRAFTWNKLAGLLGGTMFLLLFSTFVFYRGLKRYESGSAIQVEV